MKEKIPVVIIEFHDFPNLWFHKEQYETEGKFKGILKKMELSISWIKKVHHKFVSPDKFPTNDWEP